MSDFAYNVFISWSGPTSKHVAKATKVWLKRVIQAAQPFMSEEDIESGTMGLQAIADQLEAIRVGLFCITEDNQDRPWINYEAGALSKGSRSNRVIPLLFDLRGDALRPPLSQFQYRSMFDQEDMRRLTRDIATNLETPLRDEDLSAAFNVWWGSFQKELLTIKNEYQGRSPKMRSDSDKISEMLSTVRLIDRNINRFEKESKDKSYRMLNLMRGIQTFGDINHDAILDQHQYPEGEIRDFLERPATRLTL